ncbi:ABC transporter substrate-binding protein [Ketogulonicigenium vulgare]|uniref:ABC transporter substrate-binding protein n=1 Tax=Ketogulonicigenium vulgare TaxID=92945 RepID=UPI00235A426D|nr:ABC transporter substrate-binding protein [Ketogulonicigenium vulgare]
MPDDPERIVLGFYFEDFVAVGGIDAIDRVVGISRHPWQGWRPTQFERYAALKPALNDLPDIGYSETSNFSAETVIALRPDVLLMAAMDYTATPEAMAQIEGAGIPVVTLDYNAQTIERHLASTRALGAVLGSEERAEELALNYETAMNDIYARIAASDALKGRKVYVELGTRGPGTVGNSYGSSMWGSLLTSMGAENIAASQIGSYGQLSPEYVIAEQPDLIFIAGSNGTTPDAVSMGVAYDAEVARGNIAAYAQRPGWENLPAIQNGNLFGINHGGARTLSDYTYAQFIAKQLYPATFADIDPEANLMEFYAKYLPIDASGAYMISALD